VTVTGPGRRRTVAAGVVLAVLATVLVAGGFAVRRYLRGNADVVPPPVAGAVRYGVRNGSDHTAGPVSYPQSPPVGGPHDPHWQNCGFYSGSVRNELAVHSIEHGAVWITYGQPLSAADRQVLTELVRSNDYVLVSAYPSQPTPLVLTAWRNQLRLDHLDRARVDEFVRVFSGGTTAPEPWSSCHHGVGAPDVS